MIYGLDADLIFLALASQQKNIMLLRETCEIQRMGEGFSIIDIDKLKKLIVSEINHEIDENKFIKDFIFINALIF